MKAAMIGDNCIDIYTGLGKKYPTGNVVDTGVNLRKLGIPTSIISTTGDDENGQWMIAVLKSYGLDISHLKIGKGPTAITYMDMHGSERIHGEYVEGVLEHIVFDENDITFAADHDLIHTAFWGKAESILPKIKKLKTAAISFDYADRLDASLVEQTLPWVDYGFFSYKNGRDSFIERYLIDKTRQGMKIAVATFGEKGSLAYDGKKFTECKIFPARVVNTVGAGDSYIAGFLHSILLDVPLEKAMEQGAKIVSEVVSVFGPWTG
jgi:fructoselysine 6-kinase